MSDFISEKKTEIRENRIETASTLSKSNPKEINQSRDTKSIKIDVSLEDHQYLSEQAKQWKISTRSYVKMKALDRETGPGMRAREIMQLMPEFYQQVSQVGDAELRRQLMDIGGAICRCLK